MATATVATVTGTEQGWPLCSCGWEGIKTPDRKNAWKQVDKHLLQEHNQIRPKPWQTEPSSPPLYRQGRS